MRRAITIIISVLLFTGLAVAEDNRFSAKVLSVQDGDTIRIEQRVRNVHIEETCRLVGYNAPETRGKEKPLGEKAEKKLRSMVRDKTLTVQASERDKYGRLLCNAWLKDGTHVNAAMRSWLESIGYKGVGKYDHMEGGK